MSSAVVVVGGGGGVPDPDAVAEIEVEVKPDEMADRGIWCVDVELRVGVMVGMSCDV